MSKQHRSQVVPAGGLSRNLPGRRSGGRAGAGRLTGGRRSGTGLT